MLLAQSFDDKFELDLPSDGDDAVQLEQSEDEGSSLHGKQINLEICATHQKGKKQIHCYTCINDIKCAEKDAKAQGKEAFLLQGNRRRLEEMYSHLYCTGTVVSARVWAGDGP